MNLQKQSLPRQGAPLSMDPMTANSNLPHKVIVTGRAMGKSAMLLSHILARYPETAVERVHVLADCNDCIPKISTADFFDPPKDKPAKPFYKELSKIKTRNKRR